MKLYSKDNLTSLVSSMILRDRLCHSFILCGDEGVGKRTAAEYMAMQILCRRGAGTPCLECKDCRMAQKGAHPDIITITPSGKTENYRADDLRPVISDASVASNEGGYKIYLLPNADKALPAAQNILLKIFEEPPEHVIFIMTAEKKERLLSTILSRAIVIQINEASEADCLEALTDAGRSRREAEEAFDLFGGNIGKCLEYLNGGSKETFERVKKIAAALGTNDEYSLIKELYESDRETSLGILTELSKIILAACEIKQGAEQKKSYFSREAKILSDNVRLKGLIGMYSAVNLAADKLGGNSNVILTMCALGAKLKENAV